MLLAGLLGVGAGLYAIAKIGFSFGPLAAVVLGLVLIVADAKYYQYLAWNNGLRLAKGMEQDFVFEETAVVASTEIEKVVHNYTAFAALAETDKYFVLYLNKYAGYVLTKEGFLQGKPEDFRAFIQQKTGKTIRFVNI